MTYLFIWTCPFSIPTYWSPEPHQGSNLSPEVLPLSAGMPQAVQPRCITSTYHKLLYTIVKADGATPKKWLGKRL